MSKQLVNIYDVQLKTVHTNIEKFYERHNIQKGLRKTAIEIVDNKTSAAKSHLRDKESALALFVGEMKEALNENTLRQIIHVMADDKAKAKYEALVKN